MADTFEQACGCDDCEGAVSPAAYLTTLCDYTLKYVYKNGVDKIDVPYLSDLFHQPLADLPTDCGAVETTVHQVRICVETLRAFLGGRPVADAAVEAALVHAEDTHAMATYRLMLNRLGTSYDEIRRARTESPANRAALADRLGIALTVPRPDDVPGDESRNGDELDQLYLSSDTAATDHRLTASAVERLFGFADTSRDPLSDGVVFGDIQAQIRRWNLTGAEWKRNTDADGWLYLTLSTPAGGGCRLELYRDPSRAELVAAGEMPGADGVIRVQHVGNSNVRGFFDVAYVAASNTISLSAIPAIVAWRLRELRNRWGAEDFGIDRYSDGAQGQVCVVDPDLLGPDDFRSPVPKPAPGDPDCAFDLWLRRRSDIDGTLAALQQKRQDSGFDAMLEDVLGDPLPDVDRLAADLGGASSVAAQQARDTIAALSLTTEGFLRLAVIRDKAALSAADPGAAAVTADEWQDVHSILGAAWKAGQMALWCTEERDAGVALGAEEFWVSLTEPQPGEWPPASAPGHPLIDPGMITRADLPEWRVGAQARTLWDSRSAELTTLTAQLRQIRTSTGFDAMLRQALGNPAPGSPLQHDVDALRTALGSVDEDVRSAAVTAIETDLHLSVEEFARLIDVRAADAQPAPTRKPTAVDWSSVYAILTKAATIKHRYPAWAQQESDGGLTYWQARKARLPRWRASAEDRAAWQRGLADRTRPPLVDPAVTAPDDLRTMLAGDPAYDLWTARHGAADGRSVELAAIVAAAGADHRAALAAVIQETLGLNIEVLLELAAERAAGRPVESRAVQLGLDAGGFGYLSRMLAVVAAGQQLVDDEWDVVLTTLRAAEFRRSAASLRAQERVAGVTLSPDSFRLATPAPGTLPLLKTGTPFWLSVGPSRRDWQDILQSRVDRQAAVYDSVASAVSTVEESTLPMLRDALIAASGAPGETSADQAEWLAARLLIDTRDGGCRMTTRVAQAIETCQTLLFDLRSGQYAQFGPDPLALVGEHFDDEWEWISSYPKFRAASFVFLYPENICQPSLLADKSPAFAGLVSSTRGQRLDRRGACARIRDYSDYFADVCSLTIEASCEASTVVPAGEPCSRHSPVRQSMFYTFARGASGKLYWSALPVDAPVGTRHQSFWREIPAVGDVGSGRIVAAMPFRVSSIDKQLIAGYAVERSCVHLFFTSGQPGKLALQMAKLDLDDFGRWDGAVIPLSVPLPLTNAVQIVPVQTKNDLSRPALIFHAVAGEQVYHRSLNVDGTDWTPHTADWAGFSNDVGVDPYALDKTRIIRIHAAASSGGKLWLVVRRPLDYAQVGLWDLPGGGRKMSVDEGNIDFAGSSDVVLGVVPEQVSNLSGFIQPQSGVFVFIRDTTTGNAHYQHFYLGPKYVQYGSVYDALDDVTGLVPHSGPGSSIAYQRQSGLKPFYLYRYRVAAHRLVGQETVRLTLRVSAAKDVVLSVPSNALQQRRIDVAKAFTDNADSPAAVRRYLHEAYFHVPMQLVLALQAGGDYLAALDCVRTVYDYAAPATPTNLRNIYYGLELDAALVDKDLYQHAGDWLRDPLNPHLIAMTRRFTYTRFTLITLCRVLLGYADAEFTAETVDRLATARTVYLTAINLLDLEVLIQHLGECDDLIATLAIQPGADVPADVPAAAAALIRDLTSSLPANSELKSALQGVQAAFAQNVSWSVKLDDARQVVDAAVAGRPAPPTVVGTVSAKAAMLADKSALLLSDPAIDHAISEVAKNIVTDMKVKLPDFVPEWKDPVPPPPAAPPPPPAVVLGPALHFCVPPNPVLQQLRMHAELNLYKLRTCRNIAGMKRQLEVYSAATDSTTGMPTIGIGGQLMLPGTTTIRPSLYHEKVLRDRAKELVDVAAQMESAMLAALEKGAAERYSAMRARQELGLAEAGVRLQSLRVSRANHGVRLAELQRERASTASERYDEWIAAGFNEYEDAMVAGYDDAADLQELIAGDDAALQALQAMTTAATSSSPWAIGAASAAAAAVTLVAVQRADRSSRLARTQRDIQKAALYASYERRKDEWELQRDLAAIDVQIGDASIQLANDDVQISEQEKSMSELTAAQARDSVEYLTGKFTSAELYESMAMTLEGVYTFFLRYATAAARLYENQIAFLRQEAPLGAIKNDYWNIDATEGGTDQKGLTGSARLMQDLYQLDQYAFESKKRKLALSKTISLAALAPAEFQQFRESGVLTFSTPMRLFDRDFPGHYLRLISRVRTTVVALVPPVDGIHATLSNSGLSRVVVGPEVFQAVSIHRDPETVALTTPVNATGVVEMDPQTDMLSPFEGSGVDTTFEFRMPKAANQIDYRKGLADVLVTYEYTAFDSPDFRQQVVGSLKPTITAERSFSFQRGPFVDQWYDLNNPDQTPTPMRVTFETLRDDYPVNLDALEIEHVLLAFVGTDQSAVEMDVGLRYTPEGQRASVGGQARPDSGVISTRRGNAGSWAALIGRSPVGVWELELPDTEEMRRRFAQEAIVDLLLVVSYVGRLPAWPD